MKIRKLTLGNRNLIGARVTEDRLAQGMKQIELLARLQTVGVDLSTPDLSLLEGQKRPVTDIELNAIADILNVSVDWLLGRDQKKKTRTPPLGYHVPSGGVCYYLCYQYSDESIPQN